MRRRLLMALCVSVVVGIALSCASTTAPPAIPDTPAGRVFRAWLDAYDAADSARLEAYARRYEPAMSVHAQLVFRAQTGPWPELRSPGRRAARRRLAPGAARTRRVQGERETRSGERTGHHERPWLKDPAAAGGERGRQRMTRPDGA
jgi:hypothetical protein